MLDLHKLEIEAARLSGQVLPTDTQQEPTFILEANTRLKQIQCIFQYVYMYISTKCPMIKVAAVSTQ